MTKIRKEKAPLYIKRDKEDIYIARSIPDFLLHELFERINAIIQEDIFRFSTMKLDYILGFYNDDLLNKLQKLKDDIEDLHEYLLSNLKPQKEGQQWTDAYKEGFVMPDIDINEIYARAHKLGLEFYKLKESDKK